MKKIVSLALSLMLICSAFCNVIVSAEAVTTVSTPAAEAFKSLMEDSELTFNESYFFMDEFNKENVLDKSNVEPEQSLAFKLTKESDDAADLSVGIGLYDDEEGATGLPIYNWSIFSGEYVTSAMIDADGVLIPLNQFGTTHDALIPVKFGLTLQNEIKKDTTVKVELVTVDRVTEGELGEEGFSVTYTESKSLGFIEYTFKAPIAFENESLSGIASILTALRDGKDVGYATIKTALSGISDKEAIEELNNYEGLTDTVKEALVAIIDKELGEAVEKVDGNVYLPYIALSASASEYAVTATKVDAIEEPNYETMAYDITINADSNSVPTPVVKQKVVVTLPADWDKSSIEYNHKTGENTYTNWTPATVDGNTAVFYADSFSVYTLRGKKTVADENASATKVNFTMVPNASANNKFDLVIEPADGTQITNFLAAAMRYQIRTDAQILGDKTPMKNFTYTLEEADGFTITNRENVAADGHDLLGGFSFVVTADNAKEPVSASSITVATVTLKGTGHFFYQSDSYELFTQQGTSVMYCETMTDNGVKRVAVTENYNQNGADMFEIPEVKYELNFRVDFNKGLMINSNVADYVGMTLKVKGTKSGEFEVKLGSDNMPITVDTVNGVAYAKTTGDIWKLPANEVYTFEISGKGYRTFYGDVFLDDDKNVKIWTHAKTEAKENVIENDSETGEYVTFLVGDIYEDGIVDVYDLSAVTSYYNANRMITDETYSKYIPYDLNRDGYISLTDIAYVQASYGN